MPYPPSPGPRIAYDLDGTVGLVRDLAQGSWRQLTSAELSALNSERTALAGGASIGWGATPTSVIAGARVVLIFPVPLRIAAVGAVLIPGTGFAYDNSRFAVVETSKNASNGDDGDWELLLGGANAFAGDTTSVFSVPCVSIGSSGVSNTRIFPINDGYRRPWDPVTPAGYRVVSGSATRQVRALRISPFLPVSSVSGNTEAVASLRVFGAPDTAAIQDRLEFWSPSADTRLSADGLSWADVPLSSTDTRAFRIKNASPGHAAHDVFISAVSPARISTTPAPEGMLLFSVDGGVSWESSVSFATLSAGAVSSAILLRRTVPANAVLSNWSPRIQAEVGSWS